jgi:hypothetical protein
VIEGVSVSCNFSSWPSAVGCCKVKHRSTEVRVHTIQRRGASWSGLARRGEGLLSGLEDTVPTAIAMLRCAPHASIVIAVVDRTAFQVIMDESPIVIDAVRCRALAATTLFVITAPSLSSD